MNETARERARSSDADQVYSFPLLTHCSWSPEGGKAYVSIRSQMSRAWLIGYMLTHLPYHLSPHPLTVRRQPRRRRIVEQK